jgi:N utilization substance protein B
MPTITSTHLRRNSRALALQSLYAWDVAGHAVDASLGWLMEEEDPPKDITGYALELMQGVVNEYVGIDGLIHKHAPVWPVSQLAVVDRNILRLALFEIRFMPSVPSKVSINEAVELAKTFGGDSSPKFVNGVLGSVMDDQDINGK